MAPFSQVAFVTGYTLILLGLLAVLWWPPDISGQVLAAWVQALGSIGAIIASVSVAIWVDQRRADSERAARAVADRAETQKAIYSVVFAGAHLLAAVRSAHANAVNSTWGPGGPASDKGAIDAAMAAFERVRPEELPVTAMLTHLLSLSNIAAAASAYLAAKQTLWAAGGYLPPSIEFKGMTEYTLSELAKFEDLAKSAGFKVEA